MPTSVTHVTEKPFSLVKGTLTYLALGVLEEGVAVGVGEG